MQPYAICFGHLKVSTSSIAREEKSFPDYSSKSDDANFSHLYSCFYGFSVRFQVKQRGPMTMYPALNHNYHNEFT